RAAGEVALEVVGSPGLRLRIGNDRAEPRVHVGIAAAGARRDRQFLDEARENLAALGVGRALLMLDGMPFGMPRHSRKFYPFLATMIHTSARSSQGRPP